MKQVKYIVYILLLGVIGCQEADHYLFNSDARVQLDDTTRLSFSFVYLPSDVIRDTIYVPVKIIGGPQDLNRKVRLSQVTEYSISYEKDLNGYVVDSVVTEIKNKAIPGKHYVAFDDPEMSGLLYAKANEVKSDIPIIVLRDLSLKTQEVRLGIKLEVSDDFLLGESKFLYRTIVLSDQLAKPSAWNALHDWIFGEYSTARHQFMIDVLKMPIDDEWFSRSLAEIFYLRDKCAKALEVFNNDPDNIASGKAPLRENPNDPNSKVLTFPTQR
ncbi:MAG: DUF4843 domain-containing protein [Bacteroidales bacterium]|nr:DUF4843 domain-containing protein [Bacteroidales bacterium]